ncbi:putative oxidoreductase AIM17 [Grifola frondosa]|uniref:Putative oxidoreductase AIM17 n=1 Tax=Grifola frondosa TaxID=5627 RepID=A0A1C7MJD6_GRIFR|nr:putative oxidoreductase AIM17 [Grifola frondosa]
MSISDDLGLGLRSSFSACRLARFDAHSAHEFKTSRTRARPSRTAGCATPANARAVSSHPQAKSCTAPPTSPLTSSPHDGLKIADDGVHITWAEPGGHRSHYPAEFLDRYSSPSKLHAFHRDVDPEQWDAARIASVPGLFLPYADIKSPAGLLAALTQLTRYGLLFLTGVPNVETSNEACELRTLAGTLGEIRTTFYGETWDVKNRQQPQHRLHQRQPRPPHGPPVLPAPAALPDPPLPPQPPSALRESHPADFATLATTPVAYHYINDGHHLHHAHPVIQLAPFSSPPGPAPIQFVNYSPPFQAPLAPDTPPAFYAAFARFAALLEAPEAKFEYLLREGDAVVFDNRRALHARTEFAERPGAEGGATNRWLKGCYLEADAVLDRGRTLREALEHK